MDIAVCLNRGTKPVVAEYLRPKRRVSPFIEAYQRTVPCPRKQPNTIKKQQNIILTQRDTISR